jgi:hypothetical protein
MWGAAFASLAMRQCAAMMTGAPAYLAPVFNIEHAPKEKPACKGSRKRGKVFGRRRRSHTRLQPSEL